MPLSEENRALIERVDRYRVPTGDGLHEHVSFCASTMETLLNACRLEERAKAEGEVAEAKRLAGEAFQIGIHHQEDHYTARDNLAKAEARIAEGEEAIEAIRRVQAWLVGYEPTHDALCQAVGDLASRATQAEELVREVVEVLEHARRRLEEYEYAATGELRLALHPPGLRRAGR